MQPSRLFGAAPVRTFGAGRCFRRTAAGCPVPALAPGPVHSSLAMVAAVCAARGGDQRDLPAGLAAGDACRRSLQATAAERKTLAQWSRPICAVLQAEIRLTAA